MYSLMLGWLYAHGMSYAIYHAVYPELRAINRRIFMLYLGVCTCFQFFSRVLFLKTHFPIQKLYIQNTCDFTALLTYVEIFTWTKTSLQFYGKELFISGKSFHPFLPPILFYYLFHFIINFILLFILFGN